MEDICPLCKTSLMQDELCEHVIAIYDLSFSEFVFTTNDFNPYELLDDSFSSSELADFLIKEYDHLIVQSKGAPGFSSLELYIFCNQ